jgi:hypothetical protein
MKKILIASAMVMTIALITFAFQQDSAGQRLNLKIGIPRDARPTVVLPQAGSSIELSALAIERYDNSSIYRLNGAVEIRIPATLSATTVLQADEATYDPETGQIQLGENMRMSLQPIR